MEPRRRQPSTSASNNSHDERNGQRKASGSVTPKLDLDDDGLPRRTRNRNPLPPTRGPLFPPLPPKQPKNSPKNSPSNARRASGAKMPRLASSSALSNAVADDESNLSGDANTDEPIRGDGKLNASSLSLSPPPADADEPADDDEDQAGTDEENNGDKSVDADDWDAYRRGRGVRGFSGAGKVAVKVEPSEDGAAETADAEHAPETNGEVSESAARAKRDSASASAEPLSRSQRKRRGEDQLLLDDHLLPKEVRVQGSLAPRREGQKPRRSGEPSELAPEAKASSTKSGKAAEGDLAPSKKDDPEPEISGNADEADGIADEEEGDEDVDVDEDEEDGNDITRCVCQRQDIDVMMIQCDKCNVWQHGACMGIWGDDEAPDEYFCEECKPELHVPLRKWMRHCGRNPANFVAPEPEDLQRYHSRTSQVPPSQSKRWADEKVSEPPAKPPSRSHHRKEPEQSESDRRASRRGTSTAQPPSRDKAPASKDGGRERGRRGTARRLSTDLSLSASPPRGEPKKRSTMNSRDAAYEAAIKASLEEARRENSGEQSEPPEDRKRRRAEAEEGETEPPEPKKTKKRKEEDADSESHSNKPKHPNQYTYRPKSNVGPAASPARRGAGTPQPPMSGPPLMHEHGTRRAGAIASTLASQPYHAMSVNNLNWYLPDHLSQYADMLPSSTPRPLEVPTPRHLQYLTRSHFLNQRYGPFTDERDESGNLVLPDDGQLREVEGDATNHREPPTRVRYPMRRLNTAEMRKRVSNLLEYVGRVQEEERKRAERAKQIGIPSTSGPRRLSLDSNDPMANRVYKNGDRPPPPTSQELLDELTIDLIAFQEAFNTGDFESLEFAKPPIREPTPELEELPEPEPVVEDEAAVEHEGDAELEVEVDHPPGEQDQERDEAPAEEVDEESKPIDSTEESKEPSLTPTPGIQKPDPMNDVDMESEAVETSAAAVAEQEAESDRMDVDEEITLEAKVELTELAQPVAQEIPEQPPVIGEVATADVLTNEASADAAMADLAALAADADPMLEPAAEIVEPVDEPKQADAPEEVEVEVEEAADVPLDSKPVLAVDAERAVEPETEPEVAIELAA